MNLREAALKKKIDEAKPDWKDVEYLIKEAKNPNNNLYTEDITVGPLSYKKEGSLCFKDKIIDLRPQLKTLCLLFMHNHKKIVGYDVIRDQIVSSHKRKKGFKNITKYTDELHKILQKYFKRKVIFNHKTEAYFLDIDHTVRKKR